MEERIKKILENIIAILKKGKEDYYAEMICDALNDKQDKLWSFLVSNELWGGAGSLVDQALLDKKDLRGKLEKYLIELGNMQILINKVNIRTKMWIVALQKIK